MGTLTVCALATSSRAAAESVSLAGTRAVGRETSSPAPAARAFLTGTRAVRVATSYHTPRGSASSMAIRAVGAGTSSRAAAESLLSTRTWVVGAATSSHIAKSEGSLLPFTASAVASGRESFTRGGVSCTRGMLRQMIFRALSDSETENDSDYDSNSDYSDLDKTRPVSAPHHSRLPSVAFSPVTQVVVPTATASLPRQFPPLLASSSESSPP